MILNSISENILKELKKAYHNAGSRIFFLDYDGTLIPYSKLPDNAAINNEGIDLINKFATDKKNQIIIISGRDKDFLEKQFQRLHVTLVAEHGYFIKVPNGKWVNSKEVNLNWKELIWPVFNYYVDLCKGSMIEEKFASIAWHYRNAETEIGANVMYKLKEDLSDVLKFKPKLVILEGNKVLEVKSVLYDKGTAANLFLQKKSYDFILAIGDDKTDEDLFRAIPDKGFTIKIGSEPSLAKLFLNNQTEVYEFLSYLI
jgi:trehalose 6-phosphate synthase/phosphatase